MGVAQADPSFPGNAAVPPGLSPPCASCSVRAQSGRHSKATTSMGLLPRAGQQPHSGALCTHRAPQTPWVAHSALPLALETRRAHMCPCHQPPWLIFRATWGTLPRCCQPVLAHGDSHHTNRGCLRWVRCCPALVRASQGCPGKAAGAGDGAQPAEKVWQGTGSQLGLPFKLGLLHETVFPLEFAMSRECWPDLSREFILSPHSFGV